MGRGHPAGFDATSGLTYGIDDHDRLDIFKQQLVDFRRWMAQHGYRDKELLVTEYGVLMPADYGFDYPRVRDFMLGTFDTMRTATDPALGLPPMATAWCSVGAGIAWRTSNYPTGNLLDPATGQLTPLGRDFKRYIETTLTSCSVGERYKPVKRLGEGQYAFAESYHRPTSLRCSFRSHSIL